MPQHRKSATSARFVAALVILACLLLSACDSNPLPSVTPTAELNTIATPSVVASLPKNPLPTAVSRPTPLVTAIASSSPLDVVMRAISATETLESFHFVMTQTGFSSDPVKADGYIIEPSDGYVKYTQKDGRVTELLALGTRFYVRYNGNNSWADYLPSRPSPTPANSSPSPTPQEIASIKQLLGPWTDFDQLGYVSFEYKGVQSLDGDTSLLFVGKESYGGDNLPPNTTSLWVDPDTTFIRKTDRISYFPRPTPTTQNGNFTPSAQPPDVVTIEETLTFDRFDDSSITLPSP